MAADIDGNTEITTLLICKGDILDPTFPAQLKLVLELLKKLLGKEIEVNKLEPWNSVRVTLSIPRDAALRLRELANEGSQQLRNLGILSVQVEGDQVISLRLDESINSGQQGIILNTSQDGSDSSQSSALEGSNIKTVSSPEQSSDPHTVNTQFKSPNVICPSDSIVPRVSSNTTTSSNISSTSKHFGGPFPFTSMNQAIHGVNRESNFSPLPPPYPGKHPPVTISSPLLVNLLQNDGIKDCSSSTKINQNSSRIIQTSSLANKDTSISSINTINSFNSRVDDLSPNSVSPSALSTTYTSIRNYSTLIKNNCSRVATKSSLSLPVQYQKGVVSTLVSKTSLVPTVQVLESPSNESHRQSIEHVSRGKIYQNPHDVSVIMKPNDTTVTRSTGINTKAKRVNLKPSETVSSLSQDKTNTMLLKPHTENSSVATALIPKTEECIAASSLKTASQLVHCSVKEIELASKNNFPQPSTSGDLSFTSQMLASKPSVTTGVVCISNDDTVHAGCPTLNNTVLRNLPSPPPYSVAISRTWDSTVNNSSFLDITSSLTDLKPDELEELLPSLDLHENQLSDLPDDFLSTNPISTAEETNVSQSEKKKFLINPLTGELEPQTSDESDLDELQDVFTGLRSPAILSDEETCSTMRFEPNSEQSDNEARSVDKISKLKNTRDRSRDSPSLKQEKIKLRLKLEKSEPVNPAYKVDVSYINCQPKKAAMVSSTVNCEELRVPPLHISLRGRNSVVIKNKKTLDNELTKSKLKKTQEHLKIKRPESEVILPKNNELSEGRSNSSASEPLSMEHIKIRTYIDQKRNKKLKTGLEHMEIVPSLTQEGELNSKFFINNHFKEKQKERRGSDSDVVRNIKKNIEMCGNLSEDKKRRLSQTEHSEIDHLPVVGSTNVGTITSLPQKPRKDKIKLRDVFKKDSPKSKNVCKIAIDKQQTRVLSLPTAVDINMEAKFKQGLLEVNSEKIASKLLHRIDLVSAEHHRIDTPAKEMVILDTPKNSTNNTHTEKCTTSEIKSSSEMIEKITVVPNRSPTTAGGQGEDSGIESMDALSEKSPNQASQSPHAEIILSKTQVPNILDIEAQLAKMEGLDRDTYRNEAHESISMDEVNEDKCHHHANNELNQCCELTCVLQDSVAQENEIRTSYESPVAQQEIHLTHLKDKKEEDGFEPVPVRITPALYTYSSAEKSRSGLGSLTGLSDDESNACLKSNTVGCTKTSKSLLEQLLIEIPNDNQGVPNCPSPATRLSVRTRALSKLESPELISPIAKNRNISLSKRKRNESDSSTQSAEDNIKKSKKKLDVQSSETRPLDLNKTFIKKGSKVQDDSSDSDEPLIEKMKKSGNTTNTQGNLSATKPKVKNGSGTVLNNNNKGWLTSTRRSVRGNLSTQNVKGRLEKLQSDSEALRRKTRSTVMDIDKRKKEVK